MLPKYLQAEVDKACVGKTEVQKKNIIWASKVVDANFFGGNTSRTVQHPENIKLAYRILRSVGVELKEEAFPV